MQYMARARYLELSLGFMKRISHHVQPSRAISTSTSLKSTNLDNATARLPEKPSLRQANSIRTAPAAGIEEQDEGPRLPRSVQAVYLKPLRRQAQYGVPSCDLQLRSYNVRNVEFFADFALRAAYYLHLPAAGPIPLPRITERWTVPKGNFVHKKSQENFERITLRRLIQIKDGNPETVEIWLAFLKKHAYYGIGMKANVWEYDQIGVGKTMDVSLENLKHVLEPKWAHFGRKKTLGTSEKVMEIMSSDTFKDATDGSAPHSDDRVTGVWK
ncbi:MAG: mitochondrial 37S ribosomal protein rsm10 [Pycnora praestabilis]|nr:MAG: mitochondrial 37S ribosomal protein rsm10 [Pycnora praestabilis]